MSGCESKGLVSKKLLNGMNKSRPSKKKTKRRRSARKTRAAPFNGMKRMQIPSRRKRRISRKSSKSSKTVQVRGKNVDSLFEKDTRKRELPSSPLTTRVVSFQEISSGRASVSKLRASSVKCEYFPGCRLLSPRNLRAKSYTSKKEDLEFQGKTRTPLSKEDECRSPLSPKDDDDIFLQSINVELPNNIEKESARLFPEQSWSKDKRSSMGSAMGTYISCFSDWNDEFIGWEEEYDNSPELTSASRNSWDSDITSPMERSLFLDDQCAPSDDEHRISSQRIEEEGPPEGMILVTHINSKSGNRFSNFPVDCLLLEVTNWLGDSLPVFIDGDGNDRRRRCKPNCSLLDCFGKILEKPEKWGLACFVGPVNGKICWVIKVCEFSRLSGLRMSTKESRLPDHSAMVLEGLNINDACEITGKVSAKSRVTEEKYNSGCTKNEVDSCIGLEMSGSHEKDLKISLVDINIGKWKHQELGRHSVEDQNEGWRKTEQDSNMTFETASSVEFDNAELGKSLTDDQIWAAILEQKMVIENDERTNEHLKLEIEDQIEAKTPGAEVINLGKGSSDANENIEGRSQRESTARLKPYEDQIYSPDNQSIKSINSNMGSSRETLVLVNNYFNCELNVTAIIDERQNVNKLTYFKHTKPLEDFPRKYISNRVMKNSSIIDQRQKHVKVTHYRCSNSPEDCSPLNSNKTLGIFFENSGE